MVLRLGRRTLPVLAIHWLAELKCIDMDLLGGRSGVESVESLSVVELSRFSSIAT
jgi:hypothetical protein